MQYDTIYYWKHYHSLKKRELTTLGRLKTENIIQENWKHHSFSFNELLDSVLNKQIYFWPMYVDFEQGFTR